MESEFIKIEEMSDYLNIKVKTLYSLVSSGDIPHYRVGRLIRFKKEDIDIWMEGNKAGKKEDAEIPAGTHKKGGRQRKHPTQDIDRIILLTHK
jgi:excisionase family DNA binding protein